MAEAIISPGVFTRENDQTFLTQGVAQLGAVVIGPTEKGPAFVPTRITSYNEFVAKFGSNTSDTYVPNTVKDYLGNATAVTVTRVLGNGGWSFPVARGLAALVTGSTVLAVFHPSKNDTDPNALGLKQSTIAPSSSNITGSFVLSVSGRGFASAKVVSASLWSTNPNYITKTLGANEYNSLASGVYGASAFPYILFKDTANSLATSSNVTLVTSSADILFTSSVAEGYAAAETPWITDGNVSAPKELFKFVNQSHGTATNTDVYVSITNLQEIADVDGVEQYPIFTVFVRRVGDTDKLPSIVEQYTNVNLDPNSPNFIAKAIGDRYFEYDSTLGKVVTKGTYPNVSKYLRIVMSDNFTTDLTVSSLSPKTSPRGFKKLNQTIIGFAGVNLPPVVYKVTQSFDADYSSRAYLGFDFASSDNLNYLKPVPQVGSATSASINSDFTVNSLNGHPDAVYTGPLSASVDLSGVSGPLPSQLQFSVPMQGGTDGINPSIVRKLGADITATNMGGYDLSTLSTAGSKTYLKALDILSNQDEYDFNILVLPGVIKKFHSSLTSYATEMVEDRGDAFYIMDLADLNSTVNAAIAEIAGLDSNYAAVYYPWVKINDANTGRPTFVPPSVLIPGVFASSDSISAEWFAPAGLDRGGLGQVIEAKNKLSQAERDALYTNRINPIATFPGTGVSVYGQKTLQVKATALDRINVRRLLIALKKFIASSSRFLVFEQNTTVTRNRFLNIVNPYLESVQQRQGLFAYRVVMDESNNTSDVIDRNQLVGQIFLQPTRTAEFILLDFNLVPTGATFGS
jgi:hypothetical protein